MALILWDNKYSVGINTIDQQHMRLFEYLNTLYDAMKSGTGKQKVEQIIQDLITYTDYHFKTEEDLFNKHHYANRVSHVKLHDDLRKKVVEFSNKFSHGNGALTIELLNFLKDWVNDHILTQDMQYKEFLSEKTK